MAVNESWPRVSDILRSGNLVDSSFFTEGGRLKGQATHLATQYLDEGDLDVSSVDEAIRHRVEAYQRFLVEMKPEILSIEESVSHENLRYRGTLDRRLKLEGVEGILDIKSPHKAPWQGVQVAAYAGTFDRPLRRWTLHLEEDGLYHLIEHKSRDDWKVFLAALTVHNWRTNGTRA